MIILGTESELAIFSMDRLGIIEGYLYLDLVLVYSGLLSSAVQNATMIIES